MSVPDISIVICTLRRVQQLKEAVLSCLALRSQDRFSLEIFVVDNSPEAGAADLVKALAAEATLSTGRPIATSVGPKKESSAKETTTPKIVISGKRYASTCQIPLTGSGRPPAR